MRMLLIGMSRYVEQDLRAKVFANLQAQPVQYYTRHRTGDLMARMTNDFDSVRNVLGPGFMYPMDTGLTAIFSLAADDHDFAKVDVDDIGDNTACQLLGLQAR